MLGVALLLATIVRGLGRGPATAEFLFGTGALMFAALADPRARFLGPRGKPAPVPVQARYDSVWEMARSAVYPSTVGVTGLALLALVIDPRVAGVLAGALAGMGLAALVSGCRILLSERAEGVRVFVDHGRPAHLFIRDQVEISLR